MPRRSVLIQVNATRGYPISKKSHETICGAGEGLRDAIPPNALGTGGRCDCCGAHDRGRRYAYRVRAGRSAWQSRSQRDQAEAAEAGRATKLNRRGRALRHFHIHERTADANKSDRFSQRRSLRRDERGSCRDIKDAQLRRRGPAKACHGIDTPAWEFHVVVVTPHKGQFNNGVIDGYLALNTANWQTRLCEFAAIGLSGSALIDLVDCHAADACPAFALRAAENFTVSL